MIIAAFKKLKRQLKNSFENDLWNEKRYTSHDIKMLKKSSETSHHYMTRNSLKMMWMAMLAMASLMLDTRTLIIASTNMLRLYGYC